MRSTIVTGFRRIACAGSPGMVLAFCAAAPAVAASVGPRTIDIERSTIVLRVEKAGLFSALGHNHQIGAPIAGGTVDLNSLNVELHTNAAALRVRDTDASEKDRAEIQRTMLGPEVLDSGRYPEIVFRSTDVRPEGVSAWIVHGNLTLHGETRPVTVQVRERSGHYVGTSQVSQKEFGIKPVRVAGGTIRVKDEVRIEFDIQLAR